MKFYLRTEIINCIFFFRFPMTQLIVKMIEGTNLKKKDLFSKNDAYVKIYLDDKKQKQKTSVQHDSKILV